MCTYSLYFFTELTRGVWLWPPVDVSMHLTNAVFAVQYIFHIRPISPTKKWGVEQVNPQSPQLWQRDDFVCSDILRDHSQDHSRILRAADWRRQADRPRRTWLRTIELDIRPHNLGLSTAWMRAQDSSKWRHVVETAMLTDGRATRWWWWWWWWMYMYSVYTV